MKIIKCVGPFQYIRVKNKKKTKNFLSVCLKNYQDLPCGWEWGTDNEPSNPSICIRFLGLNWFSYESFPDGFIIFILGFWGIR